MTRNPKDGDDKSRQTPSPQETNSPSSSVTLQPGDGSLDDPTMAPLVEAGTIARLMGLPPGARAYIPSPGQGRRRVKPK